jgi:hypothetical protein
MTELQAQNFIQATLQGLWPDWEPTDAQYGLWSRKLKRYDYNKAKEAVNEWFCEQTINYKRPPINKILKWVGTKRAHQAINTEDYELITLYELFDPNSDWRISFAGKKGQSHQSLEESAAREVKRCESLYKRKLVIRQLWNLKKSESKLRGNQARDKAFADILNGPDTRTRRWLEKYLSKTLKKTGNVGDSIFEGSIL